MNLLPLFPFAMSIITFTLAFLCILAGRDPGYMEDYHIIAFNTSTLGKNILPNLATLLVRSPEETTLSVRSPDDSITGEIGSLASSGISSISSGVGSLTSSGINAVGSGAASLTSSGIDALGSGVASVASSGIGVLSPSLGNATASGINSLSSGAASLTSSGVNALSSEVGTATSSGITAVGSGLGAAASGLASEAGNLTSALGSNLNNITNNLADKLDKELGIQQWYSFHLMDGCEGNFTPNATTVGSTYNVINCTDPAALYHFDVASLLQSGLAKGGLNISLSDLGFTSDIQTAINDLMVPFDATFVLYCIATAGAGLEIIGAAAALFLTDNRLLTFSNWALSSITFFSLFIASSVITVTTVLVTSTVNNYGNTIGLYAVEGTKFLGLTWGAAFTMGLAGAAWVYEFFVGRSKAKKMAKTEQLMAEKLSAV